MPGPIQSWLYIRDRSGAAFEIINGARTRSYLSNPALAILGVDPCQSFTGLACPTYGYRPYLGPTIPGTVNTPGTVLNYLSTPDIAAFDITGDITIVAKVALTDWTPSTTNAIVGKWTTAPNFSYALSVLAAGTLTFNWSPDGTTIPTALTSTVPVPAANGTAKWVAVTFDVDNGASGRTARFWTSNNGINWTKLGADVTTATATTIFSGTSDLKIGAIGTGSTTPLNGKIYDVSIRTGFGTNGVPLSQPGATEKFHFSGYELTNAAASSFVAASGQTVTVNKSGSPQTTITAVQACGSFAAQTFSNPTADLAPWYNSGYPQSADALGFAVEDWTGLDDGHITRTSTAWGGYGGGSTLGAIAAAGRTMKINLFLFGRTEEAVEYLFRWLGATLSGVCSSCDTDSLLVRRFCGSTGDLWNGVAEMRNVGLIEGLKWEAEITDIGNCYVRRASFALMAGDPCMYSQDTAVTADGSDLTPTNLSSCFTTTPPDPGRAICRPACSEVKSPCRLTRAFTVNPMAAMAPIVTWTNTMTQYSFPFRAICYADPALVGPGNPCGLPILGEVYVRPIPPSAAVRWDVVGRRIEYKDETTGGWAAGGNMIDPNDPPQQRFFALPCGKGYVVMEPASYCATFNGGSSYTLDGITYDPPSYPSVSVSMGERMSCP